MKPNWIKSEHAVSFRQSITKRVTAASLAGLLAACSTSPFEPEAADVASLGPGDALSAPERTGAEVIWGGRVVGITNAAGYTEIEMLALPLDRSDRPRDRAEGGVRFVIRHPGFLEPMNYAPGRLVTALGRFSGIEPRSVGEFDIDQPVLESRRIELWPDDDSRRDSGLNFGIGVGIRL